MPHTQKLKNSSMLAVTKAYTAYIDKGILHFWADSNINLGRPLIHIKYSTLHEQILQHLTALQ